MEYFKHGDLQHYLESAPPLPESDAQQITFQILEGLHFMHGNGYSHRDLKPGVSALRALWSSVAHLIWFMETEYLSKV